MSIHFTCEKDPLIAEYFTQWAPGGTIPSEKNPSWQQIFERECTAKVLDELRKGHDPMKWAERMLEEAKLQQWYDFVVQDGKRVPAYETDRVTHKYLIPTVEVRP